MNLSDLIGTWKEEVDKMLPPVLRGSSIINFLASLVSPIQTATDYYIPYQDDINVRLKYNGQIMVLAASLNEIFGVTSAPFIRIETNTDAAGIPAFFYNDTEGIPTSFFYNSSEGIDTTFFIPDPNQNNQIPSFRVLIPSGIYTTDLEEKVRAETQLYKIAGKLFEIIQY